MLSFIKKLSLINSGSHNYQGVKDVSDVLLKEFLTLKCEHEEIVFPEQSFVNDKGVFESYKLGPLLRLFKRPEAAIKVLLVGHMDTVFEKEHSFQEITEISANKINGPGVADMKGGIVVMLEALRKFENLDCAKNLGWEVLLTPDEEIGSPGSKPYLLERAKHFDVGLVYEPSTDDFGTLAGQRKGSGDFTFVVKGKAVHAGRHFNEGKNAICAMAQLINKINSLNHQREGLTINVGNISGGGAVNVVPDLCVMRVNLRFVNAEDEPWVEESFKQVIAEVTEQTGVKIDMHGRFGKKPKHIVGKTKQLYELVKQVGANLNQDINWVPTGGCCDGNNLAEAGLANVDTLGVRGGKIHSVDEYLLVDSLVERVDLSAGILEHLAKNGF